MLTSVAFVLTEDTRRSRKLLDHYGIRTRMLAYHEHNEARMVPRVLDRLERGESLALVSDAGTPTLSDPGARLVRAVIASGHIVVSVPGASALLAALAAAGLDSERFAFFGFLPRRSGDRSAAIADVVATPHTVVLYEAPGRVAETLSAIAARGADKRAAVVARELTKKFEEYRRGTVAQLAAHYADAPPKGEIVILLGPAAPAKPDEEGLADVARALRAEGVSARDIVTRLMSEHGAPRNLAYRLAHSK